MRNQSIFVVLLAISIAFLAPDSSRADQREIPLDEQLRVLNIQPDNLASVREAARTELPHVRILAIRWLAEVGENVAPYLNDPEVRVRTRVAGVLADGGDRAGYSTLLADFDRLVPKDTEDSEALGIWLEEDATRNADLADALDIALILTRLDDPAGLSLAGQAVISGPYSAQRYRAVWVLAAGLHPDRPFEEGVRTDAQEALRQVINRESDTLVMKRLIDSVVNCGNQSAAQSLLVAARDGALDPEIRDLAGRGLRFLETEGRQ